MSRREGGPSRRIISRGVFRDSRLRHTLISRPLIMVRSSACIASSASLVSRNSMKPKPRGRLCAEAFSRKLQLNMHLLLQQALREQSAGTCKRPTTKWFWLMGVAMTERMLSALYFSPSPHVRRRASCTAAQYSGKQPGQGQSDPDAWDNALHTINELTSWHLDVQTPDADMHMQQSCAASAQRLQCSVPITSTRHSRMCA